MKGQKFIGDKGTLTMKFMNDMSTLDKMPLKLLLKRRTFGFRKNCRSLALKKYLLFQRSIKTLMGTYKVNLE